MSRLLRLELWLFAIPVFFMIALFVAGPERIRYAGAVVVYLAIAWTILAVAWMFKMILRRVRG